MESLREAFELAQQQSEAEQTHIAELVRREIDDQAWEASDSVRHAIAASNAEYARGEAVDFMVYDQRREREP